MGWSDFAHHAGHAWRNRRSRRANSGALSWNAKGGTRTRTAFRPPDPKSGASASSATFAWRPPNTQRYHCGAGSSIHGKTTVFSCRVQFDNNHRDLCMRRDRSLKFCVFCELATVPGTAGGLASFMRPRRS